MPDNNNAPSPEETSAASNVLSGGGSLPLAPAPTVQSQTAAPAAPANPEHSRIGGMFHSVLETLSGGATEPKMDPNGRIDEMPVHRTGGEWARRLIAGALTGAASGANAPVRPGGGAVGGLAAGFEGEQKALAGEDARKRDALQKNFENAAAKKKQDQESSAANDEALLRKAQIAHTTTLNASAGFDLARKKVEASEESINSFNTFQKLIAADPANVDLGVFPDMNAVLAYRQAHPEMAQQMAGGHADGQITAVPSFDENGVFNGVHAALVHPSAMDKPISDLFPEGQAPGFQYRVPGKMVNGKPGPDEWKTAQFSPGTKLADALAMNGKTAADAAKGKLDEAELALKAAQTKALGEKPVKPEKPPAAETSFDRASGEAASKDVETARGGDFRFRSMSGSYPLALKGDQQAMMNILTNHIGMTLGMQKGAKITKDILEGAQKSGSIMANIRARFDKDGMLSGVVLTPDQMQKMMTLATTQRANAWAQAVESARQGGVADKLQIPTDVRIRVKGPDGKIGTIPGGKLSAAEDAGYEVAPQ